MALDVRSPANGRVWLSPARLLWISAVGVGALVAALAFQIGWTKHQTQLAMGTCEVRGGRVTRTEGGPDWLRSKLGDTWMHWFDEVVGVDLAGTPFSDADCPIFVEFPDLEELSLDDTPVTNTGLAKLGGLTRLKRLSLTHVDISDEGLAHLRSLTNLESLTFGTYRITDAGMAHLVGLTELKHLSVSSIQLTDASLVHIAALPRLEELILEYTRVTDAGITELKSKRPRLKIRR